MLLSCISLQNDRVIRIYDDEHGKPSILGSDHVRPISRFVASQSRISQDLGDRKHEAAGDRKEEVKASIPPHTTATSAAAFKQRCVPYCTKFGFESSWLGR